MSANLYDTDHAAWLHQQAELLKAGRLTSVDAAHLIEELEAEISNYERILYRHFRVLLNHMLKWKYVPDNRPRGWRTVIDLQRDDLADILRDNPSLESVVAAAIEKAYPDAAELAADETARLEDMFPASCEWEQAEILNPDFWPD